MKIATKAKVRAAVVLTACVAATTLVTATPSSASYAPLKLYEHTGYNGYALSLYSSESNLWWNRGFGDLASSVKNNSSVAWVLYDDSGYSDRRYCIRAGESISNLHNSAWNFGDKISSAKELGSDSCAGYPRF